MSHWAFFLARADGELAGAAAIASRTPEVHMLRGRDDLAVLWDLRVHANNQRAAAGTALFRAAVDWSRAQGLTQLKIETQNTNAPACHFYAKMGAQLRGIQHHTYTGEYANDVEFNFWLDL